jgi:hypothetical protein
MGMRVWAIAGRFRLMDLAREEKESFLFFLAQFPINIEVENKSEK